MRRITFRYGGFVAEPTLLNFECRPPNVITPWVRPIIPVLILRKGEPDESPDENRCPDIAGISPVIL